MTKEDFNEAKELWKLIQADNSIDQAITAGDCIIRQANGSATKLDKGDGKGRMKQPTLRVDGAHCRFRTCDPYRVKVMLYH